jgi:hypothetical protein
MGAGGGGGELYLILQCLTLLSISIGRIEAKQDPAESCLVEQMVSVLFPKRELCRHRSTQRAMEMDLAGEDEQYEDDSRSGTRAHLTR